MNLLGIFTSSLLVSLLRAYVLTFMWQWFVVPITGFAQLTTLPA